LAAAVDAKEPHRSSFRGRGAAAKMRYVKKVEVRTHYFAPAFQGPLADTSGLLLSRQGSRSVCSGVKMRTTREGDARFMRVIRPNRQQRAQMRKRAQELKAEQKRLRELLPKPMKSTGVGTITLRKHEH
jgi:hypothetical protein